MYLVMTTELIKRQTGYLNEKIKKDATTER